MLVLVFLFVLVVLLVFFFFPAHGVRSRCTTMSHPHRYFISFEWDFAVLFSPEVAAICLYLHAIFFPPIAPGGSATQAYRQVLSRNLA